jgi:hypothetical protein
VGIYYASEFVTFPSSTGNNVPPFLNNVAANLKQLLGGQGIFLRVKSNLLGEMNQLFVEVNLFEIHY